MTYDPSTIAPYSQDAEEATLGAVLINPDALLELMFLKPEDFFILRHQFIWEAMLRLNARDETVDLLTVREELRTQERLNDIGGPGYLTQLTLNVPTSVHAEVYGRLVQRASFRRQLLSVSDEIRGLAMDETRPLQDAHLEALQKLDAIQIEDREHYLAGALSIVEYDQTQEELQERQRNGELLGYPLPESWDKLSDALPMVFPGDFVVVSGLPGSGKSALLESWAEHLASLGVRTDYIHTEMNTDQIMHRRMARHSGVSYHTLASGTANLNESRRMLQADVEIDQWVRQIAYHWMPDVPFTKLATELRRAAARGVKAFFIDHFQDIQPVVPKGGNEVRAFEQMCVWLAAFAEKRNVVVVVASQQNQQGKTKWTNKLIEKAVVWISIKRERLTSEMTYVYNGMTYMALPGEDSPKVDVLLGKARFGKKGKITMLYHGPGFLWLDTSRVRMPFKSGKVIDYQTAKEQTTNEEAGT